MDLGMYFVEKFRAGEHGYYAGRQRGQVAVYHDSSLWLYDQPRDRKAFKAAVRFAFAGNGERITGTWPSYRVE